MQTYKDFLEMMPRDIRWRFLRNACNESRLQSVSLKRLMVYNEALVRDTKKDFNYTRFVARGFLWGKSKEEEMFWKYVSWKQFDEARKCLEVQNV